MLPSFCRESVKVTRPTLVRQRGSDVPDYEHPETVFTVGGCSVQPASTSTGTSEARDATETGWTAYMPAGAGVRHGDMVTHAGTDYLVDGDPQAWPSATGRLSHVLVSLVAWRG